MRPNLDPGSRSAAELDAAYSPSLIVPDFRSILDECRRLSDVAMQTLPCELNVRYGDLPGQTLHHFPPRRAGSPLLVYVHGGHWQELGIDDSCFSARALIDQGAGFVAVGYQLAPESDLDAMVMSVATALEWVVDNAQALGTTRDAVFGAGSSAGAHLIAMALGNSPSAAAVSLAGVALLSGVYDLSQIRRTYVNAALGLSEADAGRNSPERFLPLRAGHVLVARGETETGEYCRQHGLMVAGLRRTGVGRIGSSVRSIVCAGRNHFDLPMGLGDPVDSLGHAVSQQMGFGPSR